MDSDRILILGVFLVLVVLVSVAVMAFLLRKTLYRSMVRKIEVFDRMMRSEMDYNLEKFRDSLEEQRVLFNSMREERSKTLVELYRRFTEIRQVGQRMSNLRDLRDARRCGRQVGECVAAFYQYFHDSGIHYSDDFCRFVEDFYRRSGEALERLKGASVYQPANDDEEREAVKALNAAWDAYARLLDELMTEQKNEYKRMHTGAYHLPSTSLASTLPAHDDK